MAIKLNDVALRRLDSVVLSEARTAKSGVTASELAAFLGNMFRFGYVFNTDAVNALSSAALGELVSITKAAKEIKGGHGYDPMYPNFPKQVAEASEIELYMNAIVHYFGDLVGLRIMPNYVKKPRHPLTEKVNVQEVSVVGVCELVELSRKLVGQAQPYSEQDRDDLLVLRTFVRESDVSVKENLAWLVENFSHLDWSDSFKNVTDVLRLAVAFSEGDVSLAQRTKFKLSRPQRRQVLSLIETVLTKNGSDFSDFARHSEVWKRLATALHHREHSSRFPLASAGLNAVQSGVAKTFESVLEPMLEAGKIRAAVILLKSRPGVFARRIAEVLRKTDDREFVLDAFTSVAGQVSVPVLVQMWNLFNGPDSSVLPKRIVQVKGSSKKSMVIENRVSGDNSDLITVIENGLRAHNTGAKVFFSDTGADDYAVPMAVRNASSGSKIIGRGSRIPFDEDKGTVRMFMFWRDFADYSGRVDLDLSAYFMDANFENSSTISYYNLRNGAAHHSGDITSAPDGAAEFIDIDVKKALADGWRYVVPNVLNYTRQSMKDVPDAKAGFMLREKVHSGEIFEPSTVKHAFSLAVEGVNSTPFVIDLLERKMIWWDSAITINSNYNYNVVSNEVGFQDMLKAVALGRSMTVAELAGFVADVVEDVEDADVVIDPAQSADTMRLLEL